MRGRRWGILGTLGAVGASAVTTIILATSGGVTANIWVNTSAGASPSRCPTACPYVSAHAYGSLDAAYAASSPGDLILVEPGSYSGQVIAQSAANGKPGTTPVVIRAAGTVTIAGVSFGTDGSATGPAYLTFDGNNETTMPQFTDNYSGSGLGPDHDSLLNSHVTNLGNSIGALVFTRDASNFTAQGNEIGPGCCQSDGIGIEIRSEGDPNPASISVVGNNVHDIYQSCTEVPTYLGACSGIGFGDGGCGGCDHIDGLQTFGGAGVTISRNRFYLQGGHKQGVFMSSANGGTYSNIKIDDNIFSTTSDNTLSISGPGTGLVSGFVKILYNTVQGNFQLYNTFIAVGTPVTITGNIFQGQAGNQSGGGCTMTYSDGSTLTPTWSKNLQGTTTGCGTDLSGTATFVQASWPGGANASSTGVPDLRLSGAQAAVGGGESVSCGPGKDVTVDIDNATRSAPCTIGADG